MSIAQTIQKIFERIPAGKILSSKEMYHCYDILMH